MKIRDHERILRETVERYERQIAKLIEERDFWKREAEEAADAHRGAVSELGDLNGQLLTSLCDAERMLIHIAGGGGYSGEEFFSRLDGIRSALCAAGARS